MFHSRVSRRHGRAVLSLFFAFKVSLFKDIHVQHLASLCRICGDKIKDHIKRKVDTNRVSILFLKFTKKMLKIFIYC